MAMKITVGLPVLLFSTVLVGAAAPPATHRSATAGTLSSIALSKPFGARPGWRFTALPGAEIRDPFDAAGGEVPGVIRLCISPGDGRRCRPSLDRLLTHGGAEDLFSHPHFLDDARIVYPRSHLPLLFIQAASLHSGDGDQRVATTALIYDDASDAFIPVYEKQTGKNNDQEIRYVKTGAVRGAIISSEPTADAPFGFWITVNRIGSGKRYREVLSYRSATRYNDGNPLAVIDSEMPNIQQRLKLWHSGSKLPLPAGRCSRPRLIKRELWCSSQLGG